MKLRMTMSTKEGEKRKNNETHPSIYSPIDCIWEILYPECVHSRRSANNGTTHYFAAWRQTETVDSFSRKQKLRPSAKYRTCSPLPRFLGRGTRGIKAGNVDRATINTVVVRGKWRGDRQRWRWGLGKCKEEGAESFAPVLERWKPYLE